MKIAEKHSLTLRILHWLNVPFLGLMIWSGILIYWANDIYAPVFFPAWFYDLFNIRQRLAEGMSIHFLAGWLFLLNGLVYLCWLLASGHWREFGPSRRKFNAMQKIAYSSVLIMAALAVLSGFAIYKPVQLSWLAACFGGYEGARFIHFVMMISFCLFIFLHVLQVLRAGWNNFRAMIAGFEVEND